MSDGSSSKAQALSVLKKGLRLLSERIKHKQKDLTSRLGRKEKISAEESWLDNDGNVVGEEVLVAKLLASFGRQTRLEDIQSMTETQITDFFTRE